MKEQGSQLVILASGSGTNAENIATYFRDHDSISVSKILSNKSDAYVLERARSLNIPFSSFDRPTFTNPAFLQELGSADYIILAGFLWLVPTYLIEAFPDRIINIHPALLPKFGGKGMYGQHVHEAVVNSEEGESGITIHLVNEEYDRGEILFQAKCTLDEGETADSLAKKIHVLEYEHFPRVIEDYVLAQAN